MTAAHLGPVGLELCFPCGAVWFGPGALARVLAAGPRVLRRLCQRIPPGPAGGAGGENSCCPGCALPLVAVRPAPLPHATLGACGRCGGHWVSRVTLERAAAALEAGRTPESGPPVPPSGEAGDAGGPAAIEPDRCPDCGERGSPADAACWACGRMLRGVAARACPRCGGVVRRLDIEGVVLGACESCGGVWFDEGGLKAVLFLTRELQERLLDELDRHRAGPSRPDRADLRCPHCGRDMLGQLLGSFTHHPVDTCPGCLASFLDRGALAEILLGRG